MNPNTLPQDIVPIAAAVVLGIASLFAVVGSSDGSSSSSVPVSAPTPIHSEASFDTSKLSLDGSPYIMRPGTRFQANGKWCTLGWHNTEGAPKEVGSHYYTTSATCASIRGVHGNFAKNSVKVLDSPNTLYASDSSLIGFVPDATGASNLGYPAVTGGLNWRLSSRPTSQDFKNSSARVCLASENLNAPGMICTPATKVSNTPGHPSQLDVTFEGSVPPGAVDGSPVFMVFPSGDAVPVGNVLGNSFHIVNVQKV